ncbi:hypothetical protein DEJ50_13990 [Streptomyces venezuelae]|uniref:DUF4232 domain-containing protein n=1 Tax=Streptomyces venezuelae TaxID=54571 RepID=A0A5P2D124_STRVZ|nr:DUF4232 domain-containing protein [Streptomyces venezuelae]QES48766.1 hypothetical protein DEJ50_13990 [Streptomyces venezuelae]
MSIVIVRNRWKNYAAGLAVVAALLSATACQSGGTDEGKAPGPGPSSGAPAPSADAPSTTAPTTAPTSAPSGTPGTTGTGQPGGSGSGKTVAACNDNDLSIDTSVWRQDSGQNLLITATNITDKPCTLYHYPYVGFGAEMDGPIGAMKGRPKADATIGPKGKAYAGVFLFRGGEKTTAFKSFSLGYQDRAPNSNRDVASLDIALSKEIGSLNHGPNPRVTYWNLDRRAIEDILFRSGANG